MIDLVYMKLVNPVSVSEFKSGSPKGIREPKVPSGPSDETRWATSRLEGSPPVFSSYNFDLRSE